MHGRPLCRHADPGAFESSTTGASFERLLAKTTLPVKLGRGERLWNSSDDLLDRFHIEAVPSSSGVTHVLLWRR